MTTALITGANRGIGRAATQLLADHGMTVLIAARNPEDARATAKAIGHDTHPVTLDVTDLETIRAAAKWIEQEFGTLDVLVNNAGILPEATNPNPKEIVDLDMFERTYATNVMGPVAVLQTMLPLLRRSTAGRIVNVTTTMASLTDQTDPTSPYYSMVVPAYQTSKAALNNLTITLSKQLADTPIKVTSICPGFVQTDLTPLNKTQAPTTPEAAANVILHAATLPTTAKSGTFINDSGPIPW